MKLKADYHIHSVYSKNFHGKSTIEEIAERAAELGLEEIAITDHGPKQYLFGIKKNKIKEAKQKVIEMREKYPQIKILFGVEADIINHDGDIDIYEELYELCDIILCGYHIAVTFSSLGDYMYFYVMNLLGKFNKSLSLKAEEKNTEAIVNALNKNKINILTHPGDKLKVNIDKIAAAAEKNGTILEISNKHGHLNADEIKIAAKYDVRFSIGSDAHIKDDIGNCENGIKKAIDAGLDLKRIINLA